ncbi:Uncharacterised protein [Mycobacterium tuberculosis]|uniref:Uncharacterized protein n=1 Tax=Mycobacterium tuberculosis TaxID=1773 RepID=A0A655CJB8_MYCTX|nr:Uncharacterised protein [Mycobacterium tuberculosis]CKP82038.1 Uncharacterised protein [Mycobacterium tuberculosis]CKS55821.1 Uncharacterised protein [Mycobacterium tuberculosis]CNU16028.1 Uncharacterised protein [Mycobacterium tuberculosis]CNU28951.1 Uncharacterised protein [Mycobacterium tuberculosis]
MASAVMASSPSSVNSPSPTAVSSTLDGPYPPPIAMIRSGLNSTT